MRSFLPACFLLFACGSPASGVVHLTILFTNDSHGQLEPLKGESSSRAVGGAARRMALIEKIRKEEGPANVLLVDGGDLFGGTALSEMTRGEADCAAYELMKYDAVALGDHDFDYGKKAVLDYRKRFGIPWVSANTVMRGSYQNFVRPYTLKYAGIRVGLIGFSQPGTSRLTRKGNTAGLVFNAAGASAQGLHSILKKDADFFIALSHMGLEEDKKFAKHNTFFHVIVGGHSHTLLKDPLVDKRKDGSPAGPLLAQAGSRGLFLGRLDVTIGGSKKAGFRIKDFRYQVLPLTADLPEDPQMLSLLEKYKRGLQTQPLDEVLASVTGQGGDPNLGNWTLGQITADAMREAAGADMALVNSGVFPQSPRPGPLTREGLYEVFPSDDEVVTLEVPGSLVQRVLQRSRGQAGSGAFLQVSGLRVDSADGPMSVTVGGEALQGRRKYKLAVTGFLAEGGEGYGDLQKVRSKTPSARSVRELLEKGLRARRTVEMGNPEKRWDFPLPE